jgi:hypothetical protein
MTTRLKMMLLEHNNRIADALAIMQGIPVHFKAGPVKVGRFCTWHAQFADLQVQLQAAPSQALTRQRRRPPGRGSG